MDTALPNASSAGRPGDAGVPAAAIHYPCMIMPSLRLSLWFRVEDPIIARLAEQHPALTFARGIPTAV
jgi:hypothetical protein